MDNKNLHSNELGDQRYPEPDVPVQQAWDNMQQLLLQTPAVPAKKSGIKKWVGKGMGKFLIGAGVAATVSVITVVGIKNNKQKPVTPVPSKSDSMMAGKLVVAPDTLTQVAKEKKESFVYQDVPLKKVAPDMEKVFAIKVILKDNIGDIKLTAQLDSVTLKDMVKMIAVALECRYKIDKENKQVTMFRNAAKK